VLPATHTRTIPAFTPQPQGITALWLVLIAPTKCYKVSLYENCQWQSCKAFIGLTNRAKMIGWGQPLLPEILDQNDCGKAKSQIFNLFSLVAT